MDQPFFESRSFWYLSERWVTTCMRVGLSHQKNGLPSFLALSMKFKAKSRIESSTVSILYLTPSMGCGGNGPASSIFCFPILPQRGMSVELSVSVAQE